METLTILFIGVDNEAKGCYSIDGAVRDVISDKMVETYHLHALHGSEVYREALKIYEKWSPYGMVVPYVQNGIEFVFDTAKEKAAATTNSNRPGTKTSVQKSLKV